MGDQKIGERLFLKKTIVFCISLLLSRSSSQNSSRRFAFLNQGGTNGGRMRKERKNEKNQRG